MSSLQVLCFGDLNDFLPIRDRESWISISFQGRQTLKHLIESLGIPHPEIGTVTVDDQPAGLDDYGLEGSRVQVIPFRSGDIRLRPEELGFILDGHLGKLASYLRILGFDTLYHPDAADETLAATSAAEQRVLLTRDRGLLKRRVIVYGYCIRHDEISRQLQEIVPRYNLLEEIKLFSRCPRCNGRLMPVEKSAIADRLLANTRQFFNQFWQCPACGQVYWRGSHVDRILEQIQGLLPDR